MKIEMVDIKELIPYEDNPRNNEKAVKYVKESIENFGFKVPIVVDHANVIVSGHTRLKAALQLGLEEVPVIKATDLNDEQIKAFRLADNKVSEFAEWDMALLEKELNGIADIDMESLGFETKEEIEAINMYDEHELGSLARDFIIPPVNIFDTRRGEWLERKKLWRSIIQDNGESREDVAILAGPMQKNMATVSLLDPVMAEIVNMWFMPDVEEPRTFDCFAGDTIFGYVSSFKGATFTGIELRKEQVTINNERLENANLKGHYICDDGQNVTKHIQPESQDLFFSCPPYYDLEIYSDLEQDASNQESYEDFYKIINKALKESMLCLKENRFAVVMCGDIRNQKDGGSYYGFVEDIKNTLREAGLKEYNDIVLINSFGTAGMRARLAMRNRKVINVKQNLLVFYKGDLKKIQDNFSDIEVGELEDFESDDI